jgi:glycosyltransferase involved in cell wall biosynthesis
LVVVRSLDVGGTERHLLAVLPKLAARGVPVELAVLHPGGALVDRMRAQGIVVYEANRRFGSASAFLWLVGLMRRRRPAIAHFFLPEAYLIGALAGLVADVPAMVMSRRSLNRYQLKRPTLARLERALHKRMALVSGNSDAVLAELGREGVTADRLRLIRNGIDLGPYDAMRPAAPVRAALGIATNALVLAMVANLIPYKGHADLIAALASRSADLPAGWRLLCIGRDTGIEADLRARAKVAGIDSNILWLGERSDVPDLLSASDIVVLASHEEGSPNAILEAMAARRPVIATDVGGNRELVTDGWNGILVPAADSVALGASLVSLAHDRFRMEAMGSAGRNLVGRNLGLDRCVEAYRALYDEAYLPGAAAARRAEDTLSPAGDSR